MYGFKTTALGFNKKEVIDYIKNLSFKYEENLKEKDDIIKDLEEKLKNLTENLPQKETLDADE